MITKLPLMKYFHLFLCITISAPSLAASFDCQKAQSTAEKLICSNNYVSDRDAYLSSLYAKIKRQARHPELLTKNQLAWLKQRDKCDSVICLMERYHERFVQLNHWPQTEADLTHVDKSCGSGNGVQMAGCYSDDYERQQNVMKNIIEEIETTVASQAYVEKTRKSQELWESYAQYYCESTMSLNGSWGGMQKFHCLVEHAKARIEELDQTNCYENGCPERK